MKKAFNMIFILTAVTIVCSALLATVNRLTSEPIRKAHEAEKINAIKKVLPEYDNNPLKCTCVVKEAKKEWVFYVARKGGKYVGAAYEAASPLGYNGTIRILVGVATNNKLCGLEILQQAETPGLGAKITRKEFKNQFKGKDINKTKWKVKKDGGDINAITGATISPRAVLDALKAGMKVYLKYQNKIKATE